MRDFHGLMALESLSWRCGGGITAGSLWSHNEASSCTSVAAEKEYYATCCLISLPFGQGFRMIFIESG